MNTSQIVRYIRKQGCKVKLYHDRHLFRDKSMGHYSEDERGSIIEVAVKGHTKEMVNATLIHEFAHFLQSVDGFMSYINDNYGGWAKFTAWVEGKNFSEEEVIRARDGILLLEYDAEVRTLKLASQLSIDIGPRSDYIRAINAYMADIKFTAEKRRWMDVPPCWMFSDRLPNRKSVLKPLSPRERALLEGMGRKRPRYQ